MSKSTSKRNKPVKSRISKLKLGLLLRKIGAEFDPMRRSVVDGDKTVRAFRVRYNNMTLLFPSLMDVYTWAMKPGSYEPGRSKKPTDVVPDSWILDPTDDPVTKDTKLAEE